MLNEPQVGRIEIMLSHPIPFILIEFETSKLGWMLTHDFNGTGGLSFWTSLVNLCYDPEL